MSKTKKIIIIEGTEYPAENIQLRISLEQLSQLLKNEQKDATKNCLTLLRPHVTTAVGRRRIDDITEEYVVVEEEVQEIPELVYLESEGTVGHVFRDVDFSNIVQTIRRRR